MKSLFSRDISTENPAITRGKLVAFVMELVQVLAISLAIIVPVRYFLVQPFYVKGASMEPNFFDHEYLIIDEITYRFQTPERGDIVVFRPPSDSSQFFIKRVIGLPGETVEITEGKIKIYNSEFPNGTLLDERNYFVDPVYTAVSLRQTVTVTLKADEYYVLGDNRGASLDSRSFGPIAHNSIVGRVWIRGYPVDRWKVFRPAEYNL